MDAHMQWELFGLVSLFLLFFPFIPLATGEYWPLAPRMGLFLYIENAPASRGVSYLLFARYFISIVSAAISTNAPFSSTT